jgi:glucose/arabinose dehydrogenase
LTIGDRGDRERAQDPTDTAGSVVRLRLDGSLPPDNPWVGTDPVLRTPDSVTNTQSSKVRRWEQNDTQTHLNWRQSAR